MPTASASETRVTGISYRFLLARTNLIILLLVVLLLLYVVSLVLYTLWDRSEWAHVHYARLLEEVSRQEYFVKQFETSVPLNLCRPGETGCSRSAVPALPERSLPQPGHAAQVLLPGEAPFYLLMSQPIPDEKRLDELLRLGTRFVQFDTTFWGQVSSDEQSFFISADGAMAMFLPHRSGWTVPDERKLEQFAQMKLQAFRAVMAQQHMTPAGSGKIAYWAGPEIDPFSGKQIFICFIPLRDRAGNVIAYASTDMAPAGIAPRMLSQQQAFKGDFLLFSGSGQLVQVNGDTPPASLIKRLDLSSPLTGRDRTVSVQLSHAVVEISRVIPRIGWQVVYAVSLVTVIKEKALPIGIAAAFFAILTGFIILGARRIVYTVIRPAAIQARRLRESEHFNRTVVETSPVGIAVIRRSDGEVELENGKFVPLPDWRTVGPEGIGEPLEWHAVLHQHETGTAAATATHMRSAANGHIYRVDLAEAMHNGAPVMLCVLTDMTDQKRTEQALQEAKAAAEAASAAKTLFLATISHEIRTPLYGMLASIELLEKTRLETSQRQLVNAMDGSAETLKDVLNDALDFAKTETGEIHLDIEAFDLVSEIERVVQGFASRASLKSIALHCRLDPALAGEWMGDTLKIRQVIGNLLNNAVKFSERGEVTVTGTLLPADNASPRIVLAVEDTGPGIAQEDLDRIFRPFEQAGAAGAERFSGTGLGLFICRRYAQALGGQLDVSSTLGKGSVFSLNIPLAQAPVSHEPVPARHDIALSEAATAVDRPLSANVLVVDDQIINRILLKQQLEALGCNVTLAAGGAEALAHIDERAFDAVMTDLNMPGMSGYDLVGKIREKGLSVPVLAITAGGLSGERERCLQAGMNDWLRKPFTLSALQAALARYVTALPREQAVLIPVAAAADGNAPDDPLPPDSSNIPEKIVSAVPPALSIWNPEVVAAAMESFESDIRQLKSALLDRDAERIGKIAHRVQGGVSALDVRPAIALCQTIQECVDYEWHDEIIALTPTLIDVMAQTVEDIRPD